MIAKKGNDLFDLGNFYYKAKWKCCLIILLLLEMTSVNIYAQNEEIKNLVFEGAGMKGIAYAGALTSLEDHKILDNIEKVGGTSAGALIALLVCLGYTSIEIEEIISATKFQKFNDGRLFFIGGISRTKNRYGWYRGEKFANTVGQYIERKTGNPNITFEELTQQGFKDFYCTATCLNKQKLVVLSKKTYPKMKVRDAVRISTSIPLYFQAVFVDNMGKTFKKQNQENTLDLMVDGGVIGNYPIQLFDETIINKDGKKQRIPNYQTLGIRIDSDDQINEDSKQERNLASYEVEKFTDYATALYTIIIENINRYQLTEADWKRTLSISSVGVSPRVRKLSISQKKKLIDSGESCANEYFKKMEAVPN